MKQIYRETKIDVSDNHKAALANLSDYGLETTQQYIDGAPHLKHESLRVLHSKLITQVHDYSKRFSALPTVLDMGAGEGSVTLQFLILGAKVTAVDSSISQLEALQTRCNQYKDRLAIRHEDITDMLRSTNEKYDIIVANSFLHHVPDYLGLINDAIPLLTPHGQFFSFQDPLRYDTVRKFTLLFSNLAYFFHRVFKGDVVGGVKRRIRRNRGIYLSDSIHDNSEYHVVRNGVDQDAIQDNFKARDFECDLVSYFSTQSRLFQPIGATLGLKNTFASISRRKTE